MTPEQLSPLGKKFCQMIEFDDNEQLHMEVRKHPFGLFLIYSSGIVVLLVMLGIMIAASSMNVDSVVEGSGVASSSFKSVIIAAAFFISVLAIIVTAIGAFLYRNNIVIITSEKIAQMLYLSLFNRKISQLSIADVQDVTVVQRGIFAHIFNYGTLVIETSGEQSNYTFTFLPNPYETSKALVSSHEVDVARHGN